MTTATRTQAPHGTINRARGSRAAGIPRCPCPPCRAAENSYTKHRNYLHRTGRSLLVDAAPAHQHLRTLQASGDALTVLADQHNINHGTLASIAFGPRKKISRALAQQILAIKPGNAPAGNRSVPAIGATRRIRALIALGHQLRIISTAAGMENSSASYLLNGHPQTIHYELHQRVDKAYRALSTTPANFARSLRRAEREGWGPPAAWDDGSIDDPAAGPEWTGCCGTDRGWWMHSLQHIPGCERCNVAHEQWKAEHRGLERSAFQAALMKSRASASSRGSDIAEDGRELMRLGHTYETAAARLGVTRNHLQQELLRHPEKAPEQVAA
ncbi:hypothetical protein [Streptomyces sp. B1I3]|uniref:hypothetical protein n=1 Tax=Streptomyces sp. B1I3 TaxID=3042264 RepID=UPI00277F2089|nr:hypothetical protein [Streptomyces sp. B1I3]MDQ0792044.1 hypothetical protein [Streptomyces sp. B1I3]